MEGTLADVHSLFIREYNQRSGNNYTVKDIQNYDFKGVDISLEEFLRDTDLHWKEKWNEIRPTEKDLSRKINRLKEAQFKIYVVTSREGCEKEMKNWLRREGIPYRDFVVEFKKHTLDHDIYIDDNPKLAGKAENLILYNRPWNQEVGNDKIMKRVGTSKFGHDRGKNEGFTEVIDFLC